MIENWVFLLIVTEFFVPLHPFIRRFFFEGNINGFRLSSITIYFMERNESLLSVAKFIAEYAAHMMGCGVHTSRVKRSSKRIGKAFNTDIKLNISSYELEGPCNSIKLSLKEFSN